MKVSIKELDSIVTKVLQTQYSTEEAVLMKDVLLFGELSGRPTHGLLRLLKENYGVFVEKKPGKFEYDRRTKISTVIDGKGNPGMLVGALAMKEAINLAKQHDIGFVGTKGSLNSTGSLSYYVEKIANEGFIGIVFTQSGPMMSAFGTKKAIFGTNPLAFSFPTTGQPLVFDMSTSAITFGTIAKLKAEGKQLPPDVAIDENGVMTTDPVKAMNGATLAFGSHKGSGLALVVEILGSLWPGASFSGLHTEDGWGNLYIAISPNLLSDAPIFKQKTQELIDRLKKTETTDRSTVRLPGENTLKVRDENLQRGEIEVSDTTLEKIKALL